MNKSDKHEVPIGDIVLSIRSGLSFDTEDAPPGANEPAVLRLDAVSRGDLNPDSAKRLPGELADKAKLHLTGGSLLVTRSNTLERVGDVAFVSETISNRFLPDLIWLLKPNTEKVDARWLMLYLLSTQGRKSIQRIATGTSGSMKKISIGEFKKIKVPCFSLCYQRAIASVVSSINNVSLAAKRSESLLAKRKSVLMQEMLSGQRRFRGFNDPLDEVLLSKLFRERIERNRCELELLSITANDGIVSRDSLDRKDTSTEDKSNYKRVVPGDIAYNTMRMWQGVSAMVKREGIVSPAYTVVTPRNSILAEYAACLFKTPRVINEFFRHSQGLVDDTLNLKFRHFSEIKVNMPEVAEQDRIVELFKLINREIKLLTERRSAIELQKRGVMERLLSGDVTIPDDVVERLNAEAEERERAAEAERQSELSESAS